jgi:hypothetical protein
VGKADKFKRPQGKFLVTKFEFGGSFGMEGECHEVEVTPSLEFLVTFGTSLEGVCLKRESKFHHKLILNVDGHGCD